MALPGEVVELEAAARAKVAEDGEGFVVESHHRDVRIAVVIQIARVHPHARNELAVVAQRHASFSRAFLQPHLPAGG